jgi:DNA polymerase-3 subunit gamma/tau
VLAEEASLDDLQRIVTLLMKTQTELVHSSYPLLTLEMSLIRLATLAPTQDLAKLINHIESLEKRLGSSPLSKAQHPAQHPSPTQVTNSSRPTAGPSPESPNPSPEPPPPKKPEAPVATSTESKGWQGLVDQVKQNRPMLGSVLEHGRLLKLELPVIEVGYAKGSFMISQLQEQDISQDLEVLTTDYFGQPVKLRILPVDIEQQNTAPPSLAEERQAKETDRMRRLRDDAMEHPALKTVQDIFNGKIEKVIPIDKGFV